MFQQGFFAHVDQTGTTPFDRMRAGGVSFRAAGENLALAPTVQIAHDGLMNSPGHRANILNPRYRPDRHRRGRRRDARQDVHPELRRLSARRTGWPIVRFATCATLNVHNRWCDNASRRPLRPLPVLRVDLQLLRLRSPGDGLRPRSRATSTAVVAELRHAAAAADPQHLLRRRHAEPDDARAGSRDPRLPLPSTFDVLPDCRDHARSATPATSTVERAARIPRGRRQSAQHRRAEPRRRD